MTFNSRILRTACLAAAAAALLSTAGCGLFRSRYFDSYTVAHKLGIENPQIEKDFYTGVVTISDARGHTLRGTLGSEWISLNGEPVRLSERVRHDGVHVRFPSEVVKVAKPAFRSSTTGP